MEPTLTTADVRAALRALARDLTLASRPDVRSLLRRLDPELFERVRENPCAFVDALPEEALERATSDGAFAAEAQRLLDELASLRDHPTWWQRAHGDERELLVAYFSCEFGLDESLPLYSGGLGVLAGDHLKSASDLGLPLV